MGESAADAPSRASVIRAVAALLPFVRGGDRPAAPAEGVLL
jgi:hypothetical protein